MRLVMTKLQMRTLSEITMDAPKGRYKNYRHSSGASVGQP